MSADQALNIGRIGRPHGLMGTVRFFPHSGNSEVLDTVKVMWIGLSFEQSTPHKINSVKPFKDHLLVTFKPSIGRDGAEALRNHTVWVDRACFDHIDGYFLDDLIGIKVVQFLNETDQDQEEQVGEHIGYISGFGDQGGVDLIEIDRGNRKIYIPWISQFVVEVHEREGDLVMVLTPQAPVDL